MEFESLIQRAALAIWISKMEARQDARAMFVRSTRHNWRPFSSNTETIHGIGRSQRLLCSYLNLPQWISIHVCIRKMEARQFAEVEFGVLSGLNHRHIGHPLIPNGKDDTSYQDESRVSASLIAEAQQFAKYSGHSWKIWNRVYDHEFKFIQKEYNETL